MTERKNITGLILAGGKSSRMGTDKGLMPFGEKKLVEHVISNVKPVTDHILIIGGNEDYLQLGYPVIPDSISNCGPLGGIHAGLTHSLTEWNLILSCDLPNASEALFRFIIPKMGSFDAIVPVHVNMKEPLCALYNKSALPKIEEMILQKELKMQTVIDKLNACLVNVPEEKFDPKIIFENINFPYQVPVKFANETV